MKGKMTLFLLAYGLIHTARLGATVADMLKDPALLAHVPGVADAGAHIRHYTKDDEPRAATTRGLTVYRCFKFLEGVRHIEEQLADARRDGVDSWRARRTHEECDELLRLVDDCCQLSQVLGIGEQPTCWQDLKLFFNGQTRAVPSFAYFTFAAQTSQVVNDLNAIDSSISGGAEATYKTIGLSGSGADYTFNPATNPGLQITDAYVYRLVENLTYSQVTGDAFKISADNVVLDLAGYTVTLSDTGPGYPRSGVFLEADYKQVAVKNGSIVQEAIAGAVVTYGLLLQGTQTISENLFCANLFRGINEENTGAFTQGIIRNCTIVNSSQYGIHCNDLALFLDRGVIAIENGDSGGEAGLSIGVDGSVLARDSVFALGYRGVNRVADTGSRSTLLLGCATLDNVNAGFVAAGAQQANSRMVCANCYARNNGSSVPVDNYIGDNVRFTESFTPTTGLYWESMSL